MSCITEILKLKGDKKILPIIHDEHGKVKVVIEGGGHYLGFEYLITFTYMGHRCAYVAVPPNHPADKRFNDIDDADVSCHGGVTFCEREHQAKDLLGEHHCNDLWIGFDAAHWDDAPSLEKVEEYFGETDWVKYCKEKPDFYYNNKIGTHKTYKFMERQCRKIIHQLIKMEKAA